MLKRDVSVLWMSMRAPRWSLNSESRTPQFCDGIERERIGCRFIRPYLYHYLTAQCVHTSRVEICKRMEQVMGGVKGVRKCIGINTVYNDICADNKKLK